MPTVEVDLVNSTSVEIDAHHLSEHLSVILRRLGRVGTVIVEISLVKDPAIQKLNHQFLQKDSPTDVLSFENPNYTEAGDVPLGSLVISTDTATNQAQEAGITLQDEVEMLSGHGLLHLLGFNHK